MIAKFKVEGEIEIELNNADIQRFIQFKSELMKKDFLEELFYKKLNDYSEIVRNEIDASVDFDNLFIVRDWDKYAGNMRHKKEMYGSPLAITIENTPITNKEVVETTMNEIANRKKRHSLK